MEANPYSTPTSNPVHYPPSGNEGISDEIISELRGTRPWVLFMAILIFIGSGFMFLAALIMMLGSAASKMGGAGVALGAVYIVMGAIYIAPGVLLFRYASAIRALTYSRTADDLRLALSKQRVFWKFVGIITICVIVLYIFVIIAAVFIGASGTIM
ncbi:MAG: DUF5362 family protein [Verrucomicrobiales bacterium]